VTWRLPVNDAATTTKSAYNGNPNLRRESDNARASPTRRVTAQLSTILTSSQLYPAHNKLSITPNALLTTSNRCEVVPEDWAVQQRPRRAPSCSKTVSGLLPTPPHRFRGRTSIADKSPGFLGTNISQHYRTAIAPTTSGDGQGVISAEPLPSVGSNAAASRVQEQHATTAARTLSLGSSGVRSGDTPAPLTVTVTSIDRVNPNWNPVSWEIQRSISPPIHRKCSPG